VVPAALSVAVLLISLVSVHRYFVVYTPERIYGSLNGVVSTELGKYARAELGPDWRVYFFGLPRMYAGFSSFPYLAPDVDYVDGHKPLEEPVNLDMVTPDKNAAFIFLPERADDMRLILNEFPGGEIREFPSPHERQPLFTLYRLPREKIPERSR
jgi:hypothetical protein